MKSWKTTTVGILLFVMAAATAGVALLDGDPVTVPQWEVVVAAFLAMIGLSAARDNDKSSEDVQAKE